MSNVKDGGPAFPRPEAFTPDGYMNSPAQDGMTLRQWYAGLALMGRMASADFENHPYSQDAKACVEAADALIAELEGGA